jgi:hypothetical protein
MTGQLEFGYYPRPLDLTAGPITVGAPVIGEGPHARGRFTGKKRFHRIVTVFRMEWTGHHRSRSGGDRRAS